MPNAETWLDFTDLVFIDPAGTGYSRALASSPDARRRLWSVEGDIEYLAEAIRRWLDRFDRNVSPKYLLGESYGGFRVPRLARELAANQGTGVSGLVMISPALDLGGHSSAFEPFDYVTRLPSMTAAARAEQGTVTRAGLADVEHYATTEFLLDLTRGERDAAAIARRSARVAEFTGLDPALVRRYHGLIDNKVFLHELDRARGRVGSSYDATITSADPFPLETLSDYPDPVLDGLSAPVSSAMVAILRDAAELAAGQHLPVGGRPGEPPVGLGPRNMAPAAVHAGDAYRAGTRPASRGADRARAVRSGHAVSGDAVAARSGAGGGASAAAFVCRSIRAGTCSTPTMPRARRCATRPRGCSGGADFDGRDRRGLRGGNRVCLVARSCPRSPRAPGSQCRCVDVFGRRCTVRDNSLIGTALLPALYALSGGSGSRLEDRGRRWVGLREAFAVRSLSDGRTGTLQTLGWGIPMRKLGATPGRAIMISTSSVPSEPSQKYQAGKPTRPRVRT